MTHIAGEYMENRVSWRETLLRKITLNMSFPNTEGRKQTKKKKKKSTQNLEALED